MKTPTDNKDTFEKRIADKKWLLYLPNYKGVKVYIKTTHHGSGESAQPLMNVALVKDNNWYNYVLFAGDDPYLEEKVNHFIVDCKMKEDWKKHLKG